MIHKDQKNRTTQWWSTGRHFTAATQALNTICIKLNKTDEKKSPQEAKAAVKNSSLGFIEAVHQW